MINNIFSNSIGSLPHFSGFGLGILTILSLLLIAWVLFSKVLKGYALWTSAKRDEVPWFIALLLINSMGILELIYLFFIVGMGSGKDDSSPSI